LKRVIIIFTIIVIVTGAFYYLKYYFEKEDIEIWELVPKNALAVYELQDPVNTWNEFLQLPFWENLSTIPEIGEFNNEIIELDTISSTKGNLEELLRDKKILISFHKVSNTDLDIILYFPLNTIEKRRILSAIISFYNNRQNVEHIVRTYEDISIHEITVSKEKSVFCYMEYKNYFIGSFTPFLIDDVVRNISNDFQTNFKSSLAEIFNTKPIETDQGNIYLNMAKIPDLMRNFVEPSEGRKFNNPLHWLAEAAYYDISFEGNRLYFNGSSSVPENNREYFLSTFYNQSPQSIKLINYLPGLTATCLSYTYSDFISWRKAVDEFWQANLPELLNEKTNFLQKYSVYEKDFYEWIGNEIGIATIQSINIKNPDKIVFIHSDEIEKGLKTLDDLTLFVNHTNEDTLLYEVYGDKTIKKINVNEFPAIILGGEFSGFESTFYTSIDNFIVFGNSFDVLKMMMNDIGEENTWGKSLKFVQFFDNIQKKSNISYFVNFSNSWNSFYGSLNETWNEFFKKFDYQFKHFELISFQFSNINNNFYTSAAIQHRSKTSVIETPSSFFKEKIVVTDHPIVTKPFVVKSHLDRSLEIVLQDSANYLYLISGNGEILWKQSIGQRIIGDIFQVDFYKNNKLQYFFATKDGLYIIDRNGVYLTGFPVIFPEEIDVEWVNLVDYDNSKRYRFLLGGSNGSIYLFDKYGEQLDGWNPKKMKGSFSSVPFHFRIGGRDCMMSIEKKGAINLFNRRGENYDGFPVKFEFEIQSPVFIQRGTDFNRSLVHFILETGEMNKCNLSGEIVEKNQLYRPGKESYFEIVPDVLNNTYIVCRQDFNNISIMRPNGEVIFERELLFSGKLDVQFYNFSAANEIYALTDEQQDFTYFFDGNGNLINQQPFGSSFKIGLIYSEVNNNFRLYSCYGNQFSISSFYKK